MINSATILDKKQKQKAQHHSLSSPAEHPCCVSPTPLACCPLVDPFLARRRYQLQPTLSLNAPELSRIQDHIGIPGYQTGLIIAENDSVIFKPDCRIVRQ